jgi:hypothetical protein
MCLHDVPTHNVEICDAMLLHDVLCRDNCKDDYWLCGTCQLSTVRVYREPLHGVLGHYPTEGELGYGEPLADRLAKVRIPLEIFSCPGFECLRVWECWLLNYGFCGGCFHT